VVRPCCVSDAKGINQLTILESSTFSISLSNYTYHNAVHPIVFQILR